MIKISKKEKILKLIAGEKLTSSVISKRIGITSKSLWPYLKTLVDEKVIERTNDKKPYEYRALTPLRYLIDLYKLMDNKMDFTKTPDSEDIELIKKIELVIK